MAFLEVLVYNRVAYETNKCGDNDVGVPGHVRNLAVVLVEVERSDGTSMGTYIVDLVVDKEV